MLCGAGLRAALRFPSGVEELVMPAVVAAEVETLLGDIGGGRGDSVSGVLSGDGEVGDSSGLPSLGESILAAASVGLSKPKVRVLVSACQSDTLLQMFGKERRRRHSSERQTARK